MTVEAEEAEQVERTSLELEVDSIRPRLLDRAGLLLPTIVVVGILLRLTSATVLGNPYDFEIWRSTEVAIFSFHINGYLWWSQGPLALPILLLAEVPLVALTPNAGASVPAVQNLFLHLPFIAGDLLVGYALYRLLQHLGSSRRLSLTVMACWALLPGSWWIGAAHGQMDTWVPATILMSMVFAVERRFRLSGVLLGIGVGILYAPLVAIPAIAIYAKRRNGWRAVWQVGAFAAITVLACLLVLFLADIAIGPKNDLQLFFQRNSWWSIGTANGSGSLGSSTANLVQTFNSPYPALIALLYNLGLPVPTGLSHLPTILTLLGILLPPLFLVAKLKLSRSQITETQLFRLTLLCVCITVASVGCLSQVAVTGHLYWVLPLLLLLASSYESTLGVVLAAIFSSLYLLPEFFNISPLEYIRSGYKTPGVAFLGSMFLRWSAYGTKTLAPVLGLIVPFVAAACIAVCVLSRSPRSKNRSHTALLVGRVLSVAGTLSIVGTVGLVVWWRESSAASASSTLGITVPCAIAVLLASLGGSTAKEKAKLIRGGFLVVLAVAGLAILLLPLGTEIVRWWPS